MIKKIISINLFLFCLLISICKSNYGKVVCRSKLDSIGSLNDINSLINLIDTSNYKSYCLEEISYPHDELNIMIKQNDLKPFYKLDFNSDKIIDLLIYHTEWDIHYISVDSICALHINRIPNSRHKFLKPSNNKNGLFEIMRFEHIFINGNWEDTITSTYLEYVENKFLEFYPKFSFNPIDKIEYSTLGCYGECPIFELSIKSDRSASYNAIDFNDSTGFFETILDQENFDSIIDILNSVNFKAIKDTFKVGWTDDQTCITKITFMTGETKTIYDYGQSSLNRLIIFYNKVYSLRQNQNWKRK